MLDMLNREVPITYDEFAKYMENNIRLNLVEEYLNKNNEIYVDKFKIAKLLGMSLKGEDIDVFNS